MATETRITLIQLNPIDGILSVRATIIRTDDVIDELSKPMTHEENINFKVPDLSTFNVSLDAVTMKGDDACKILKKAAQKAMRRHFNGKPGAIAAAITGLDPNG